MNFWGVSNRPTEILDSLLLMSVVGSISCSAAAAGWVPVTRQASELMTACARIWVCKSQAHSHGRLSRAKVWLTALHHSQGDFADSYSGSKTKLIFRYCGVYLYNNTVTCHEAVIAVGYSTAQSALGTKAVKMSWACTDMHLDRALSDSLDLDT